MLARNVRRLFALFALLSAALFGAGATAAAPHSDVIPGKYIVIFKDSVLDTGGRARALAARHGLTLDFIYSHALKGFAGSIPAGVLARLRAEPDVVSVSENRVVTINAQTLPTGIDRIDGELSSTRSGDGSGSVNVDVAVLDTGIETTHPDLNVAGGKICTGTSFNDVNGHGTHLAGTIAARDNGIGVVGVAPGARLWAVKVMNDNGSGTIASVVCGIDWVTQNAATIEVANLSIGASGRDDGNCGNTNNDAMHKAICRAVGAGVTFTATAGGSRSDAANFIPASYDEVITVSALVDCDGKPGGLGACTNDDGFASFSNYGADIDLIASGSSVYSTWRGGSYATLSGTSMATAHVTGAAALYKSTHAGATPAQVRSALLSAGNLNWNTATDPDSIHEKLVNVASF